MHKHTDTHTRPHTVHGEKFYCIEWQRAEQNRTEPRTHSIIIKQTPWWRWKPFSLWQMTTSATATTRTASDDDVVHVTKYAISYKRRMENECNDERDKLMVNGTSGRDGSIYTRCLLPSIGLTIFAQTTIYSSDSGSRWEAKTNDSLSLPKGKCDSFYREFTSLL